MNAVRKIIDTAQLSAFVDMPQDILDNKQVELIALPVNTLEPLEQKANELDNSAEKLDGTTFDLPLFLAKWSGIISETALHKLAAEDGRARYILRPDR
ncbi:hypothetical protein NO1_0004 [Candidatus Termititenax aidoneus]|uniref:Uncharacterized protein n=1 Tax=Termititenax aidoneus TaxID=2218524 RepID=A0A388T8G9_TERA1|nr:hypothetical protein NO1_0004 [Candidatus Termititenax aidoneus]